MVPQPPEIHIYPSTVYPYLLALTAAASLLAVVCLWYGVKTFGEEPNLSKMILFGAWVLLPPLWFLIEWFVIYPHYGLPNSFEQFKYGQDVVSKFWAAIGVVLAGLYLHH